ncbi:MAG: hypothetical protein AAF458_00530 [Pseudomonadota bacterium]
MTDARARLLSDLGVDRHERPSMDVLLQLTLPIVLILALIMTVEVSEYVDAMAELEAENDELRTERDAAVSDQRSMRADFERSATGELVQELERMVLTIQHQLLLKAVADSADAEADDIGLGRYAVEVPEPGALAAGDLSPAFRETTLALAARFNGDSAVRNTRTRLTAAVEARFDELAITYLDENPHMRRRAPALRQIEADNRVAFLTALDGHLARLSGVGFDVQMDLLTAWLQNPQATVRVDDAEVASLWNRIQEASGDELDALLAQFANLRIRDAFAALAKAELEPLADVRRAATQQAEAR